MDVDDDDDDDDNNELGGMEMDGMDEDAQEQREQYVPMSSWIYVSVDFLFA